MPIFSNRKLNKLILWYILIIITFSIIINHMSYSFFQSNIDYDPDYLMDKNKLLQQCKQEFVYFHQLLDKNRSNESAFKEENIYLGSYILSFTELKFKDLVIVDDNLQISLSVKLTSNDDNDIIKYFKDRITITIPTEEELHYLSKNNIEFYGKPIIDIESIIKDGSSGFPIDYTVLFHYNGQFKNQYLITHDLKEKLLHFYHNNQGYMNKQVEGNWLKALYLSVVTITTLGFGDIVPVTTNARILIAIESIIGLIMMGLIVNSFVNPKV